MLSCCCIWSWHAHRCHLGTWRRLTTWWQIRDLWWQICDLFKAAWGKPDRSEGVYITLHHCRFERSGKKALKTASVLNWRWKEKPKYRGSRKINMRMCDNYSEDRRPQSSCRPAKLAFGREPSAFLSKGQAAVCARLGFRSRGTNNTSCIR